MGADTDAARAEVVASRAALLEEVQRLESSARAAIDIPAKIRRAPAKTAGLAAGTAFLALGGPQRLFRRARRAVRGPEADLPKSLLPKDIEKVVQKLGTDGDRVRGTLEREFVRYLDERSKVRRQSDASELLTSVALLSILVGIAVTLREAAGRASLLARLGRVRQGNGQGPRAVRAGGVVRGVLGGVPRVHRPSRSHRGRCGRPATAGPEGLIPGGRGSPTLTPRWASGGMADAPALGAGAP